MADVGFIGLGIMGRPMAGHLQKAGHKLFFDRRHSVPDERVTGGGIVCSSGKEVAERAEIIITIVPDTAHVSEALFGSDGIVEGLRPGKIVVDVSSISPIETKKFAEMIVAVGGEYLDAPISGGELGAKVASLTIMVGGKREIFERVKPLFDLMDANVTLVGGYGDGQTCKVANQIIVAGTIETVAEALLFASKAGADPVKVRQTLMGGFASSRILEVHGQRMIDHKFDSGFRMELHQKDLNLALSAARMLQISLPNTATCQELFNSCTAHGGDKWDHSGMARALEWLANHEIGNRP